MFGSVSHQIIYIAAHRDTTAPAVLYGIGFALQVVGGVIVLLEIRGDRRAAERIRTGGPTWADIGAAPEVVRSRLSAVGGRLLGVALIFVGAAVGLTANLLALYG